MEKTFLEIAFAAIGAARLQLKFSGGRRFSCAAPLSCVRARVNQRARARASTTKADGARPAKKTAIERARDEGEDRGELMERRTLVCAFNQRRRRRRRLASLFAHQRQQSAARSILLEHMSARARARWPRSASAYKSGARQRGAQLSLVAQHHSLLAVSRRHEIRSVRAHNARHRRHLR